MQIPVVELVWNSLLRIRSQSLLFSKASSTLLSLCTFSAVKANIGGMARPLANIVQHFGSQYGIALSAFYYRLCVDQQYFGITKLYPIAGATVPACFNGFGLRS